MQGYPILPDTLHGLVEVRGTNGSVGRQWENNQTFGVLLALNNASRECRQDI